MIRLDWLYYQWNKVYCRSWFWHRYDIMASSCLIDFTVGEASFIADPGALTLEIILKGGSKKEIQNYCIFGTYSPIPHICYFTWFPPKNQLFILNRIYGVVIEIYSFEDSLRMKTFVVNVKCILGLSVWIDVQESPFIGYFACLLFGHVVWWSTALWTPRRSQGGAKSRGVTD